MPYMHQQVSHSRHDYELRHGPHEKIPRPLQHDLEVLRGQRQSHRQHNQSQNHRLRIPMHPFEDSRQQERDDGYGDDECRGMFGEPLAKPL